jgi:hypothetical protein
LYWQARAPVDRSYTVFLHLLDGQGKLIAQADGLPAAGVRPTSSWAPGEVVAGRRTLAAQKGLLPGEYQLTVGCTWWRPWNACLFCKPEGRLRGTVQG